MKNLLISEDVLKKLSEKTPPVSRNEVEHCFSNRVKGLLIDSRANNQTTPPTLWFLAPTNKGRILKIVYIQREQIIHLRTAYDPNPEEERIYQQYA